MLTRVFALSLALVAVGCAPVPRGEQVPFQQVLQEVSGRPYICLDYDAETDACDLVARYRVRGEKLFYTVDARVSLSGAVIPFEARWQERIAGAETCDVPGSITAQVQVPDLPPQMKSYLNELFQGILQQADASCTSYFRAPGGGYELLVRDQTGRFQPRLLGTLSYSETRKDMRVIE